MEREPRAPPWVAVSKASRRSAVAAGTELSRRTSLTPPDCEHLLPAAVWQRAAGGFSQDRRRRPSRGRGMDLAAWQQLVSRRRCQVLLGAARRPRRRRAFIARAGVLGNDHAAGAVVARAAAGPQWRGSLRTAATGLCPRHADERQHGAEEPDQQAGGHRHGRDSIGKAACCTPAVLPTAAFRAIRFRAVRSPVNPVTVCPGCVPAAAAGPLPRRR